MGDDICSYWQGWGGAGDASRRKEGGDQEVQNSWLCILHEGEEPMTQRMTIHCDQKDDTVSPLGFREPQTDSEAPQFLLTRAVCRSVDGRELLTAKQYFLSVP